MESRCDCARSRNSSNWFSSIQLFVLNRVPTCDSSLQNTVRSISKFLDAIACQLGPFQHVRRRSRHDRRRGDRAWRGRRSLARRIRRLPCVGRASPDRPDENQNANCKVNHAASGRRLHASSVFVERTRVFDRPSYCPRADRAHPRTPAQMRNAPKYCVAAAYQVAAYVMQPACAAGLVSAAGTNEVMRRR